MYDLKLKKNEKIELISDNTKIYTDKEIKEYTCIITNQRLLILDYPSSINNPMEDLRISGRMNYVRKKEVVTEINLKNINKIIQNKDYHEIILQNGQYINLNDDTIIDYINHNM